MRLQLLLLLLLFKLLFIFKCINPIELEEVARIIMALSNDDFFLLLFLRRRFMR